MPQGPCGRNTACGKPDHAKLQAAGLDQGIHPPWGYHPGPVGLLLGGSPMYGAPGQPLLVMPMQRLCVAHSLLPFSHCRAQTMSKAPASSGTGQTQRHHSELSFPSHPRANHSVWQVKPLCNLHLDFALVPCRAIRVSVHKPGFLLPFINYTGIYMKLALMEVPMQLLCPVSHPGAKQSFAAALGLDTKGCSMLPWSFFSMSTHPLHIAVMH